MATLAVDLTAQGARAQELQNTSDAAALAGIVEYQEQILAGASQADAEAAARDLVEEIMAQNGIDPGLDNIAVELTVSDDGSKLEVRITDNDPDQFLPSDILGETIKPHDPSIERRATAEFLACANECSLIVEIKAPFGSVNARGNGDGYKPIRVGDNLYAINHNSGNRNIVCINTITENPCWADGVFRTAYSSSVGYNDRNPEMPHTAVVGTRIYWTATDRNNGLRLFCWEAASGLDVPCSRAVTLDGSLRRYDVGDADSTLVDDKDENRGGGTFTVFGDKVFAFSDNHRIHCFDPVVDGTCSGYANGGNPTALDVFPANSPVDGNHGSSIDRIVDENSGYVYSTLHIPFAQNVDCTSPLADPAGERVVVLNQLTGRYLATSSPDNVYAASDGADDRTWWDVENYGSDTVSFQSANHGEYLDAGPFATTSSGRSEDDRWDIQIDAGVDGYYINSENVDFAAGSLFDDDGTIVEEDDPPSSPQAEWNFYPWQCGIDPGATSSAPSYYRSGTWLHCYDTGAVSGSPGTCPGFQVTGVDGADPSTPSPIHLDGTRFSGRLWFYYASASGDAEPTKLGVCSSGYGQWYDPAATYKDPSTINVNCVDISTGSYSSSMSSAMSPVRNAIQSWTGTDPAAWGDPHWNAEQNRLFYPTEHRRSRIICFDFDDGPCGEITGTVPPNASGITVTEDYGFVSDENCVYALGHTAFFWAFKASNIQEPCDARIPPSRIERCGCGDGLTFRWGELDFRDIDMSRFDVFGVRIVTDDGGDGTTSLPIYPVDGSFHSMKPGGADRQIPLDDLAIPEGAVSILIEFDVEGLDADAVENVGDFEIRFAQRPKLVD